MFKKLTSNYNLSNILCRIMFVVTYAFSNWQNFLLSANLVVTENTFALAILCAVFVGALLMLFLPMVINMTLNMLRLYSIPRAEYTLIVYFFFILGMFFNGVLGLINVFTPILLGWGTIVFPFLVSTLCVFAFYKVTARMYFNDVTVVSYFRTIAVVYLIMALVTGVF